MVVVFAEKDFNVFSKVLVKARLKQTTALVNILQEFGGNPLLFLAKINYFAEKARNHTIFN